LSITRWPSHITTPRANGESNTTSLDATQLSGSLGKLG
jgi:hypothetical protein